MESNLNRICRGFLVFCLPPLLFLSSCDLPKKAQAVYDFPEIVEKDTLTVLTLNTSISYFIYRDQSMGFHYDMIKDFCDRHGLMPKIKTAVNSNALVDMLLKGDGDLIAYDVPIENTLKDSLIYCGLTQVSRQVLVQRNTKRDTLIKDVPELIGKEVYVKAHTKYDQRLKNLNRELGGGIVIRDVEKDTIVDEDLIRMVSSGKIRYTVADEYIAKINRTYFGNIDISLPLSFDQRSSWAVRKDMPVLADSLNAWFAQENITPNYRRISKRYFEEAKGFSVSPKQSYLTFLKAGQLSPYDEQFKKAGEEFGIDWRLLASISFFESTFNPDGEAWTGAGGLMGLMPATAESLGLGRDEMFDPAKNIRAGAKYMRKLLQSFSAVENDDDRIKMVLASYNAGIGHIFDARALAKKYNADENVWADNVEKYLELKRVERYYDDPVCRCGYFRAEETLNYVGSVMRCWAAYKEVVGF
ncbi:MAG: transglycosylase SLT domain-containing protein [Dysgonamonadaceae bacterium]|jgi:membrane-bound lytic murein transglycosylase F|nr:transglycosylase SLT domain-containing protein [Dysgonamonadaceae bacterium]